MFDCYVCSTMESDSGTAIAKKILVHATAVTIPLKDDLHPTYDAWELPRVVLTFR